MKGWGNERCRLAHLANSGCLCQQCAILRAMPCLPKPRQVAECCDLAKVERRPDKHAAPPFGPGAEHEM
jgi:hypothetical protein